MQKAIGSKPVVYCCFGLENASPESFRREDPGPQSF